MSESTSFEELLKAKDKIKILEKRVIELETALFNKNSNDTIKEMNESQTVNLESLAEPS